ncbi:MAG: WG repeat-containing protein [Clostridia bacterium]|nr:WG repeat-containing protein [Clostridia bacterium]
MSGGKRYDKNAKLNKKKVLAVILVFLVLIMFVVIITKLLNKEVSTTQRKYETAYFTVFSDNKWGVIDNEGKTIINPEYDEMIIIPNPYKAVFVCTYDVNYDDGTYKSKAINEKNENLFERYDTVEAISNIDEQNSLWYEKDILKVCKDGKYGLMSIDGTEIVRCEYDGITPLKNIQKRFITVKDGKQGLLDNNGEVIIESEYTQIQALTNNVEDGYIVKDSNNKYGVVNKSTKVLDCKYEEIANVCGENMYVVKENSKWKIVDSQKNEYLEGVFDKVKSINGENIIISKNNVYGVVDKLNNKIIPMEYKELTYTFDDNYIAKKDKLYGIINTAKEMKVEYKYNKMTYRSNIECVEAEKEDYTSDLIDKNFEIKLSGIVCEVEENKGYIKMREDGEYKYYNFRFEQTESNKFLIENTLFLSKKDGKYGFVDKNGIVKVDYIYDDAIEQNKNGYAAIKKDGLWGSINQEGTVVVEPKYSLENNLVIDFIGEWHISEDINAGYYTK